MSSRTAFLRTGLVAALVGVALSACGAAPSTGASSSASTAPSVAPSAAPSVVPSVAPSLAPSVAPSLAPSVAPSAAPSVAPSAAAGVLPQALVFMREGQIVRMEPDGKTTTPLTAEQPFQPDVLAIIDFDVSPADGTLAYIVQGDAGNVLVRTDRDGGQRTVLLPSANISTVQWTPDGTQLTIHYWQPVAGESGLAGGVYLVPAHGGDPTLLQADDLNDPEKPSPDARGYLPVAWSSDGTRLLLSAFSQSVEVCSAAVKDVATGALIPIQAPDTMVSACDSGRWSIDGKAIYLQMARPGPQPPVPGLWQADPTTGAITPFLQGEFETGAKQLVVAQQPLPNGQMYAFVANVTTLPEPFGGTMPQYKLFTVSPTDSLPLRDEDFTVTGTSLWAPDGSGVVADLSTGDQGNVVTAWIPTDGGPVVELGPFMGEAKAWAGN